MTTSSLRQPGRRRIRLCVYLRRPARRGCSISKKSTPTRIASGCWPPEATPSTMPWVSWIFSLALHHTQSSITHPAHGQFYDEVSALRRDRGPDGGTGRRDARDIHAPTAASAAFL